MDIILLHLIKISFIFFFKLDELIYIKNIFFLIFYFLAGQPANLLTHGGAGWADIFNPNY